MLWYVAIHFVSSVCNIVQIIIKCQTDASSCNVYVKCSDSVKPLSAVAVVAATLTTSVLIMTNLGSDNSHKTHHTHHTNVAYIATYSYVKSYELIVL